MKYIKKLKSRITVANGSKLDHKHIFILPNKNGLIFIVAIIVMLFFGLNYENNLILAVCFFLGNSLAISIFYSYFNIRGISVKISTPEYDIFADSIISIPIFISQHNDKEVYALEIQAKNGSSQLIDKITNLTNSSINTSPKKRGYFALPRVKVSSSYPLGLFTAFSYIEPNIKILVLPKPISCEYFLDKIPTKGNFANQENKITITNNINHDNDEINGLKPYKMGDSIKLIDWKQYAKGRGLMVKNFSFEQNASMFLTKNSIRSQQFEEQISMLTYATIDLSTRNIPFGVNFHEIIISPELGKKHRKAILQALATL